MISRLFPSAFHFVHEADWALRFPTHSPDHPSDEDLSPGTPGEWMGHGALLEDPDLQRDLFRFAEPSGEFLRNSVVCIARVH
jgi:hypothetical protein